MISILFIFTSRSIVHTCSARDIVCTAKLNKLFLTFNFFFTFSMFLKIFPENPIIQQERLHFNNLKFFYVVIKQIVSVAWNQQIRRNWPENIAQFLQFMLIEIIEIISGVFVRHILICVGTIQYISRRTK